MIPDSVFDLVRELNRRLADRSLSRLLKEDWPKTLEELEERKRR